MKKILTFLLMVISAQMFAQNYPVTSINITLPANPDPNTANWGSGASVFIINATARTGPAGIDKLLIESKILVTIKNGGNKICGSYSGSNAPASNFNTITKVWSGQNAVSLLGKSCILKPGEYMVCVQFFGLRNDLLSEEKCKPFSIRSQEPQNFIAPQTISPADGSMISEADAKKPIAFRWAPVVPKPKEEVHYILRVFEIRQGQTATAAMKSVTPILEKEVINQTQFALPSLSPYPIAKDSKYGWCVQATNKEGNSIGENNGISEASTFTSVNNYGINDEGIKKIVCDCKGEGWIKDKPVLITSGGGQPIGNVMCGGNIILSSPGSYQIIAPPYICNPANCPTTYQWTVQGPGGLTGTGTGNSFNFNFSSPGTYGVTITPHCGNYNCPPCEFKVVVKGTICECKGWMSGKPVVIQSLANQSVSNVLCGGSIGLGTTGSYQITVPDFFCNPATVCPTTYKWEVFGPVTGNGTGKPFTFNFSSAGTYTVIVTPYCGNQPCEPCKILVTIKPPLCDCKGEGWIKDKPVIITSGGGQPIGNVMCGGNIILSSPGSYQIIAPPYICNPANCPTAYQWTVQGPGGISGSGSGNSFNFNFSSPGTYGVTITPHCGNYNCPPCEFKVVVKGTICECKGWMSGKPVVIQSLANQSVSNVLCGGSIGLGTTGSYQITVPDFFCNPATVCPTTYKWEVFGPVTGNGTGKPFTFNFSAAGTYTVVVTPYCGSQPCEPCKFTVVIKDGPGCNCGKWKDITVVILSNVTQASVNVKCGGTISPGNAGAYQVTASDFICLPTACLPTYKWEVFGPVSGNGTGKPFTFNFSAIGIYTIIITPYCGNVKCDPCKFEVIIKK